MLKFILPLLALLPTGGHLPKVSALPFTPGPQLSRAHRTWLWVCWAIWYPVDWLLYEDAYDRHVAETGLVSFRVIMSPGVPPPSYRHLLRFLEGIRAKKYRVLTSEDDLAAAFGKK